jgi:hypothetical protein
MASVAYTSAKMAAPLAKAKKAHDDLIAAAFRAQADALEIEALASRRLADEYDAAQERGEIARHGETLRNGPDVPKRNGGKATAADVGLSRKEIHEARLIRDAEKVRPKLKREVRRRRHQSAWVTLDGRQPCTSAASLTFLKMGRRLSSTCRPKSGPTLDLRSFLTIRGNVKSYGAAEECSASSS